jgi:hypothetical protein
MVEALKEGRRKRQKFFPPNRRIGTHWASR